MDDFSIDALDFGGINIDDGIDDNIFEGVNDANEEIDIYGNKEVSVLSVKIKLKKKQLSLYLTDDEKIAKEFYEKTVSDRKFKNGSEIYILPWGRGVTNVLLLEKILSKSDSPEKITILESEIMKNVNDNGFEYNMLMEHLTMVMDRDNK